MEAEEYVMIITFMIIVIINFFIFDILRLKKEQRNVEPKQLDPDAEEYEELHEAISKGDIDLVRCLLRDDAAEQDFSHRGYSALYQAFSCQQYEIASYLIHRGAKFNNFEDYAVYRLDIDLTRVNYLLLDYNKKLEKSCIFRLISWSQSPQGFNGQRLSAVMSMLERFFKSDIIKLLMQVLENEAFDIVYDFSSVDINRIHRFHENESDIFGLTLSNSKEIFIGAKYLLSSDPRKRAQVYGVVAEELCHLALTTLFENYAKPYREEDSKLKQEFEEIVSAVKSLLDGPCPIESVVKDVFTNYDDYQWECELIARVPHVIGIYEEELGRRTFLESPELSRLLLFYEKNVIPKCKKYLEPSLNTKPHQMMKRLVNKNDFISFREKQIQPLKEGFLPFTESLVEVKGIFMITTNCEKLCTLQVYHELKSEYGDELEKKCLFLSRKCFEEKREKILEALKGIVWEYFILVVDEKELNMQRLKYQYIDDFHEFIIKSMKIIIISDSHILAQTFKSKTVNYKWQDLSDEYKDFRTQTIGYIFKGERHSHCMKKENVPNAFSEKDIVRIMSGEVIEVSDGSELFSKGYISSTYIEREFRVMSVDKNIFKNLPQDTNIFLSGLSRREFQWLSIDESVVQWLHGSDDEIKDDISIFIVNDKGSMSFENFTKKNRKKSKIWLHHAGKEFILKISNSSDDTFKKYLKEIRLSEKEMLKSLESKRIVIISDNAGHGKSTVISSLISDLKNKYDSWLCRIDFKKFCTKEEEPLSLANIDQNSDEAKVLNQLFLMLGINDLEKQLFMEFSYNGHCFLFFDGFDEIPSKYKNNALRLLSIVKSKTYANMTVSTRKHHQKELEELLNTFSYELVPFSRDAQVKYLEKLWKNKLKYPNGEGLHTSQRDEKDVKKKIKNIIQELKKEETKLDTEHLDLKHALENLPMDSERCILASDCGISGHESILDILRSEIEKLDFTKLAKKILCKTSLDKETFAFMGIPLHLYMIGIIYYDRNFNVEILSDIYSLYSEFIEQKIKIYLEEKQDILHDGREKNDMVKLRREDAYRIHMKIADQLMDGGNAYLDSQEDIELCIDLGIVFKHGEEVNFLHLTFAEFFKAESLRREVKKEDFIKMLLDDKYNIVRKFLSSALEQKDFENLTKEFFEEISFLESIIKEMPSAYALDISDYFCVCKIVKKLLENFEEIAEHSLVSKFIGKVEAILKERKFLPGKERCFHYFHYVYKILGCLPVSMLKNLVTRNSTVNTIVIFSFVRYSENSHEIIDVLKEYISMKSVGKCESDNIDVGVGGLLELLSFKDSDGKDLLYHALWNGRAEFFTNLLKFLRDALDKEQFIKAIIQSDKYRKQIERFIESALLNRICGAIKGLHYIFGNETESNDDRDEVNKCIGEVQPNTNSICRLSEGLFTIFRNEMESDEYRDQIKGFLGEVHPMNRVHNSFNVLHTVFGNEMENLISKDSKYLVIDKAVLLGGLDELSDSFEKVNSLFIKSFGREELGDFLLSRDYDGNYLIHVVCKYLNSTFIRHLNLIKEVLSEDETLKRVIKKKGEYFNNMFHLAASKSDICLDELLQFCQAYFERDEIQQMLLCDDGYGYNVIHSLTRNNSSEMLMKNLKLIKGILGDFKWFQKLLESKSKCLKSILHFAAERSINLDDLLHFCDSILGKEDLKKMILSTSGDGSNVMHCLFRNNSSEMLMKNLLILREISGDEDWFKGLLKSEDECLRGIFQFVSKRDMNLDELLQLCDSYLDKKEMKEMLLRTDKNGCNILHNLFTNNSFETLLKNLLIIKNATGDDKWFKKFRKSKDECLRIIFQFTSKKHKCLKNLLLLCEALLEKDEIQEILLGTDEEDFDVIHYLFGNNSSETLMKNLKLIKETLGNDERLKQFLKRNGKCYTNMFHFAAKRETYLCDLLQFCHAHLKKDEIKELLLSSDKDGYDVVDIFLRHNASETLMKNLKAVKEITGEDKWFKDLIKPKADDFRKLINSAAKRDMYFDELIRFCDANFEKGEVKEMLFNNVPDQLNVMHHLFRNDSPKTLIKNLNLLKEIFGDAKWFKELLKSKVDYFRKMIHLAAKGDSYLCDILPFYGDNFEKEEIKEMFISTSEYGLNVVQTLFQNHSSEMIMKNLLVIKEILRDDEWLKQVLKSKGISFENMLQSSMEEKYLDDLLQFCYDHLEKEEIRKIILTNKRHGNRLIDQLIINKSSESIMKNLKLIKQILGDNELLKQLLKSNGQSRKNIFQLASIEGICLNNLLRFCDEHLEKDDMKEMFLATDADGDNVIHCFVLKNSPETLMDNIKIIKEIVADDDWFKRLLKSKGQSSKNIFHLATVEDMHLHDLLQFCDTNLTKEDLKEMLKCPIENGNNVIHLSVLKNSPETLMKNLKVIKQIVGNDEWLKELLMSKGQSSMNILQLASIEDNNLNGLLQFCDEHLEKDEIKEMLEATDEDGDKVVHLLVLRNSSKTFIKNLEMIKEVVEDDDWFRGLLKSTGQSSNNIFHLVSIDNVYLEDILRFFDANLEKEEIKEMLEATDKDEDKVIHILVLKNSPETLIKNLNTMKEIVSDEEWFKDILQSKGQSSKNIFHLATIKGMYLNDLLRFCVTHLEKVEIKEMLFSTIVNGNNIIHLSVLKSSSETLIKNLLLFEEILGDEEWLKEFLISKGQSHNNIFQLASTEDKDLHDLLHFCDTHLEKYQIKEMLFSTDEDRDNQIHRLVLYNSSDTLMKNLNTIKEVVDDEEWLKKLLKSKGQSSKNIFHLASVEDVYLNDLMKFCSAHLEKYDIKEMLISPTEHGNNVIHLCVLKNSSETLIKNLKLIKEIVGDDQWLRKLLKSKGQSFMNIFQLASMEDNNLENLLLFCNTHLKKEEIKEMLLATDGDGDKVIHLLVLKNSHETLNKNLKIIKEIVEDDEWLKKLLQSKGQSSKNIFHLASKEDICLENLLKFSHSYLEKDTIKEILLSADKYDDNIIHVLVLNKSSETIMKILNLIKQIIGDDLWFKKLLTSRGQSCKNIFQLASIRGIYLEDMLRFCYAHLEKEELKEMLFSTREYGYNVIHLLVAKSSSEMLLKTLKIFKEILSDDEFFNNLLTSKAQSSRNIFHLASSTDVFDTLLQFCDTHLEKDTIKNMLCGTDKNGDNLIHILVLKKSHESLMKNLKLIQEIVNDAEWFKNFLKSKGQSLKNIFQLASIEDMYLENLLQFCNAHLQKEELKEMLVASDGDGDKVIHLLVLKNSSETLMKNLKAINEVVSDDKWFKQLLKSKGQSSKNIFQLALLDDLRLDNLLRFCDSHLEKLEIQEMLLSTDTFGDNLLHVLVMRKSSESLMKNLKIIKDIVGDDKCFKDLLKSKGQSSKNIIQLASIEGMHLKDLLRFCVAFLEKDFIKEMLVSTSQYGDNVIHLLVLKNSPETLIKNLRVVKEVICDDEWFKKVLMSKGQSSKNILHLASVEDIYLNDLLRFCNEHLEKCEVMEMLMSVTENDNNVIHLCVLKNSSEMLIKNLLIIKEILGDDKLLKKLLKSKGQSFKNILQLASLEDVYLHDLIRFCDSNLNKDDIKEMILSINDHGDNVMHLLVLKNSPKNLVKNLKLIQETVRDDMWFKQLLKSKGQSSKNIFHLVSVENIDLNDLVQFCDVILEKEEIKDMFLSAFVNNNKVIHLLVLFNSSGTLVSNLNLIKEIVSDSEWFKLLLESKGESFRNVFHFAALNENGLNPFIFNSYLSEGKVAELLIERDKDGRTCLHHAAFHMSNFPVFLDHAEKMLKFHKGKFEELILAMDKQGDTFLHCLGVGLNKGKMKTLVNKIFDTMGEKLQHELYKKLLRMRNKKGLTFLQIKHSHSGKINECCKQALEKDLFEDLLKPNTVKEMHEAL